jgi:hypothetical protein
VTTSANWFAVDKDGLAKLLRRRGPGFAVLELLQNSWDEDGVTRVTVTLEPILGRKGVARLVVEDDAPDGFANLTHAYTLYAESAKKAQPTKRGRFNLGEKLVIALCEEVTITSTRGGVSFTDLGRVATRRKRERGSRFEAVIRFTRLDVERATTAVFAVLPPQGIGTTFNGRLLEPRTPVLAFEATLPTELADEEGYLKSRTRPTTIELYEVQSGEVATLYEMGIPVVELPGDRWHVNIDQKVPLNADRDNVTPAYLRTVRTFVVNHTYELLTREDATATWAREATADPRIEPAAVVHALDVMFGKRRVSFDPNDLEANHRAVSEGYTIVHGGSLSGGQWEQVKRSEAIRPAGRLFPTPRPESSPDGEPPVPVEEWTPRMRLIAEYAQMVGGVLLGFTPSVEFYRTANSEFSAWYGSRTIGFCMKRLRHWFVRDELPDQEEVDRLLIHEYGHEGGPNHLSHEYHENLCRLGARMRRVLATLESWASWIPEGEAR